MSSFYAQNYTFASFTTGKSGKPFELSVDSVVVVGFIIDLFWNYRQNVQLNRTEVPVVNSNLLANGTKIPVVN
jgi:hypothetical protein